MYACFTRQPILKNDLLLIAFSLTFSEGEACPETLKFFHKALSDEWLFGEKRFIVDYEKQCSLLNSHSLETLSKHLVYEFDAQHADKALEVIQEHDYPLLIAFRDLPPAGHKSIEFTQFIFHQSPWSLILSQPQVAALAPFSVLQIADHIEAPDLFLNLQHTKYRFLDGFRGDFFMSLPIKHKKRTLNPTARTLTTIMQLVSDDLSFLEIEDILRQDIALTYKLLRYVNSPAFGMRSPIIHIRDALHILGLNNLFRWLSLQMLSHASGPGAMAMADMSLIRARFLDLIGTRFLQQAKSDFLYLIGAFSSLNHILGMPFEEIFKEVPMNDDVMMALEEEKGRYGPLLKLAKALELPHPDTAIELSKSIGIPIDIINSAHYDALSWLALTRKATATI